MKLNKTEILILTAMAQAYGPQTVSELYRALPPGLFSTKNALSSRLCEMRGRNLTNSVTLDSGINEWQATDGALRMLPDAIDGDISAVPEPAVSEPIQPDSPDILRDADRTDMHDPIAADFAAAIEAADEVVSTELPDSEPNPPVCADAETIIDLIERGDMEYAHPEVSDDLIEEANSLRLQNPFPRLRDALYVLAVLADFIGDRPAMVTELDRISDYLEREAA